MTPHARPLAVAACSAALWLAATPAPPRACDAAIHHEVDFLLGNWLVRDERGAVLGTYTARRAFDDCVVIERWRAAGIDPVREGLGVIGYDADRQTWQRTFLDTSGGVLVLDGGWNGDALAMQGNEYHQDLAIPNRVSWTPGPRGTVTVRWEASRAPDDPWRIRFGGILIRIAE